MYRYYLIVYYFLKYKNTFFWLFLPCPFWAYVVLANGYVFLVGSWYGSRLVLSSYFEYSICQVICWFVSLLMKDAYLSVMCKNNNDFLCVQVVVKWKNGLFHGMCFIFSLLVSLIWLEYKYQFQVQYWVEKRVPKFGTLSKMTTSVLSNEKI